MSRYGKLMSRQFIPFDEIVCILVPPKAEIQRRNIGANTQIIAPAEAKQIEGMSEGGFDCFAGADIEDGSDIVKASLHIRASALEKPEKAHDVVERVPVRVRARVGPQLCLFLRHLVPCLIDWDALDLVPASVGFLVRLSAILNDMAATTAEEAGALKTNQARGRLEATVVVGKA
ncbi:unnamed protein product [Clonostachys solani]|uniref:Uncharacterized protein n=1 Tax=Clonostachys solani TaxID=160281 RepID=A0A9N9ZI07_9HYPO|nr:unnamed protein product [Clonostachys solani]